MMLRFELNRLTEFSNEEILKELLRVSSLVEGGTLTKAEFDKHAKVSTNSIRRRFGGWQQALEAAGIGHRYGGMTVTPKMKSQFAKKLSNDQLVAELQRVASVLGKNTLTKDELNQHSSLISARAIADRFGSWKTGLEVADLALTNHGKRHSEDDYFENLLIVWTYHARQPLYREMNVPPSRIAPGAYAKRWGTWSRALLAFVERANSDLQQPTNTQPAAQIPETTSISKQVVQNDEDKHAIKLGLRYSVLSRDRFRCVICGASPATDIGCQLHVDHIVPFAKGGKTIIENLRALCQDCNLGKGDKVELITFE